MVSLSLTFIPLLYRMIEVALTRESGITLPVPIELLLTALLSHRATTKSKHQMANSTHLLKRIETFSSPKVLRMSTDLSALLPRTISISKASLETTSAYRTNPLSITIIKTTTTQPSRWNQLAVWAIARIKATLPSWTSKPSRNSTKSGH